MKAACLVCCVLQKHIAAGLAHSTFHRMPSQTDTYPCAAARRSSAKNVASLLGTASCFI